MAEINITPFTDVLLVLLIIFMILASLALPPGFERQLANCACGAARMTHPKHIPVTVTQHGVILVAGKAVTVRDLYGVLAKLHENAPKETVTLYADVKAPYGLIVRVLDAAKAGGIPDVSFVTE